VPRQIWLGLASLALGACATAKPAWVSLERSWWIMDTRLDLRIQGDDRAAVLAASEAVLEAVRQADRRLSAWEPQSALSLLNSAPAGHEITVPAGLSRDIEGARACWRATRRGFDPVAGASAEAIHRGGPISASFPDLVLTGSSAYTKRHAGANLDSGGFGKGQALEDAAAAIEHANNAAAIRAVTVDFGGQVFWWRPAPKTGPDRRLMGRETFAAVAVASPASRDQRVLEISLRDYVPQESGASGRQFSIATSAGSERGRHIIDPGTGEPVPMRFVSVTVLAESPLWADCLSTGLYVLYARDPELAFRTAAARRVDMVAVETGPKRIRAIVTAGLKGRVTSLMPELRIFIPPMRLDSGIPP